MLTFFLILIANALLIVYLFYIYQQNKNAIQAGKKNIDDKDAELRHLRVSERAHQKRIQKLEHELQQTKEDPLTNVLGWQLFTDRLQHSIRESTRYHITLGVLFIEINEMKTVQNALGEDIYEALLLETAERLQSCIRKVDSIARFNQNIFVILLEQLVKPEVAAVIAQRILQALLQPFKIKGHTLYVTANIGITICPVDSENSDELLRFAERALNVAKENGKHGFQFYQEKMHSESQRELALYVGLSREGLFNELLLFYQPIMNLQNKTLFCLDAWLHWQHPTLGLIGSEEVLNYAEKQRKMNVISEWLLRNACKQFQSWQSENIKPQYLGLSLSVNQLESSQLIYHISQILQGMNFNPKFLMIEIKVGLAQVSFDVLEKAFNMLTYLGIKVAIGEFGRTGFPLPYLRQLHIDYLKLDRAFIDDITQHAKSAALVHSIITMAKNLSIEVITAGVETQDEVKSLAAMGCVLIEGPYVSEPLKHDEVLLKIQEVLTSNV